MKPDLESCAALGP